MNDVRCMNSAQFRCTASKNNKFNEETTTKNPESSFFGLEKQKFEFENYFLIKNHHVNSISKLNRFYILKYIQ